MKIPRAEASPAPATGPKRPRVHLATDSMRSQPYHKKARCEQQLPTVPPLPGDGPTTGATRPEKPSRLRYPIMCIEEWTSDEDDPGSPGSTRTLSIDSSSTTVATAAPSAVHSPQPPRPPTPRRRSSSSSDLAGTSPPRPIPLRLRAEALSEKELAVQRIKERQLNCAIVAQRSQGSWAIDASSAFPIPNATSAARLEYHRSQLVERMERTLSACRRISRKLQRTAVAVKQPQAAPDALAEPLARRTKRKRDEPHSACIGAESGQAGRGADNGFGTATLSRGASGTGTGTSTFSMILIVDEESRNLERMLKRIKRT